MYQLFNKRPEILRGTVLLPEFIYIKNGLYANLLKITSFYRDNPRAVRSSHFLVRLLQSITVSKNMADLRYVDNVSDVADNLAMSLKMTSPIYTGRAFEDGVFYGRETTEVLISNTEEFDVGMAAIDWEDLEPIKILTHPKTDLNLDLPNGTPNGSETGLAVIAINIPMLALQYKKWYEHELRVNEDNPRTIMQFITEFPLTNMLPRQLDIALFNRMRATMKGIKPMESRLRTPLQTIDYTDKVDEFLVKLNDILHRKHLYLDTMLASMPMVSSEDALDLISMPTLPPTRQVVWSLFIAKLPYVSYILQLNEETATRKNRRELNQINRSLIRLRIDREMRQALPNDLYDEVQDKIENEITAYL